MSMPFQRCRNGLISARQPTSACLCPVALVSDRSREPERSGCRGKDPPAREEVPAPGTHRWRPWCRRNGRNRRFGVPCTVGPVELEVRGI